MRIRVECYSGYRGEETPRRFFLGRRPVVVAEVHDRWYGPDHRYFKVEGDDACLYILRHDERSSAWTLTVFDSRRYDGVSPYWPGSNRMPS
ncbi:MAG: hypothetical protein ACE5Q3_07630 [Alphaproteobacteria bacterium]